MDGEEIHRKANQRWNIPWDAHEFTSSCYRRQAFLSKERTCHFLADAVNRARVTWQFDVWAYVMMPEHMHLLIWPTQEVYMVSTMLKAIKQSVSRRAVNWLKRENPSGLRLLETGWKNKPYEFWQDGGGYDRNTRNARALRDMIDYIHNNPVRRGLVARPEDWPWSSARDWADMGEGPIHIDKETCLISLV
jgi:putative transposase